MRKAFYLLGELQDTDLEIILELGRPERMAVGTHVLQADVSSSNLFIVLDGELVVHENGAKLGSIGAGELIGEMSLIDGRRPAVTVTVKREALLFAVPNESLRERIEADSPFAARIYRATCILLADRLNHVDTLLSGGGDRRISKSAGGVRPSTLERVSLAGARYQWFAERARATEAV